MSNQEFEKRKDFICALPFAGMTISPRSEITLCCNSAEFALGKMNAIPDLKGFYNGPEFSEIRGKIDQGKILDVKNCRWCYSRYKNGFHNTAYNANHDWMHNLSKNFDLDWRLREEGRPAPVRYLEYTSSNTCNQACSTCTSFYSSKWHQIEASFSANEVEYLNRPLHSRTALSSADIDKIMTTLPDLVQISVKGGEPWADKNNLKILSRLLDVNPTCEIQIVSNMHKLNDAALDIVKRFRDHKGHVFLGASIDGVEREYEWIRSTPFAQTTESMQKYYDQSGRRISIVTCLSLHNIFSLQKIPQYFKDKEYIQDIFMMNPAGIHPYLEYQALPSEVLIEKKQWYAKAFQKTETEMTAAGKRFQYHLIEQVDQIDRSVFNDENLVKAFAWIEKVNSLRGFRLEDHVPELTTLRKKVMNPSSPTRSLGFASLRAAAEKIFSTFQ